MASNVARKRPQAKTSEFTGKSIKIDKEAMLKKLATGNLEFGLDLHRLMCSEGSRGNVFFSPLSINVALAMTRAGAMGTTLQQLTNALHLPDIDQGLNEAYAELQESLNETSVYPNP